MTFDDKRNELREICDKFVSCCCDDCPMASISIGCDLGDDDIQRLKCIVSHFTQKQLILLDVGEKFCNTVEANAQFSHETYYRILGLNLLPHTVTRILYLDSDMLIQKSGAVKKQL